MLKAQSELLFRHASLIATLLILMLDLSNVTASENINDSPLSPAQLGDLLMADLRCASCHGNRADNGFLERAAPVLSDVGARVAPDYLRRFLESPSSTHPGTLMPDMLSSYSDSKREEIAEALTHFLVSQSQHTFESASIDKPQPDVGKELFHSIGCVACHSPREAIEVESPDDDEKDERDVGKKKIAPSVGIRLEHLPSKYSHSSLSTFLFQPLQVRPSGRMPDMKLTTTESQAIASYLLGEQSTNRESLKPEKAKVALGEKYFLELNCAACHTLSGKAPALVRNSINVNSLDRGCLSKSSDSNRTSNGPKFHIDDSQMKAIEASLKTERIPDTQAVQIAKTMTAFNCIACHVRNDYGGVAADRNPYFRTSEKNLGDDGRIPPPLTLVGAKLQPVWLKKVLFDGESVRPYMTTRMPQFGEPNLRHLPELLGQCDVLDHVDLKLPNPESNNKAEKEREKKLRAGGRELIGDQGLNCVACHNFNGKPSPINKGIDLMTTYQRLQPAWFNNFLRNPVAYRPRIVMPVSWPGGIAAHKTILDGDTEMQIEAIWYYLSLGTSAADPSGIRRLETKLAVGDATRTYRGRSSVAGFRGIAVGFPERISYAFNAETGTLTAIWLGDFIRVERGGQGSGSFNPSGKAITLSQDVSFAALADDQAPWPLRPVMTKEAPANPNPLYPKNQGYQFKEYFFDESSVPTFVYRSGSIVIEDRSVAANVGDQLILKRTLQFSSPGNQFVWFRALTGEIASESEQIFKTRNLRLMVPKSLTMLRTLSQEPKASQEPKSLELLLKLDIPQGKSSLELIYEPLQE